MFSFFRRKIDIKNKEVLVFVGSPRTGSTLLGQIINFHPNCYIANESRLVQRVIENNEKIEKVLQNIYKDAQNHFKQSLENDKKYGKTIDRYQPKWQNMQHLTNDIDFEKKEIKYLGDKKAGGVSQVYKNEKEKTLKFFKENEKIKMIQIIRNPINAAKSLMKSHNVESFEDACESIIEKTYLAEKLIEETNNKALQLYYEDLLKEPQKEIKKIIEFLELEVNLNWIEKISTIITSTDNETFSENEIEIMNKLILQYNSMLLKKYI
jgi:hypothetical protein